MRVLYSSKDQRKEIPHFRREGHRLIASKPVTREELIEAALEVMGGRLRTYKYKREVAGVRAIQPDVRTVDQSPKEAVPPPLVGWLQCLYDATAVEAFIVAFFKHGILYEVTEFARGTRDSVFFEPGEVVSRAVRLRADSAITAHNHPGGIAEPSVQDIRANNRLGISLAAVGCYLDDAWIVGRTDWSSARQLGLMSDSYFDTLNRMAGAAAN